MDKALFRALALAAAPVLVGTSGALAQTTLSVPGQGATASQQQLVTFAPFATNAAGGPTTWNADQQVYALNGARTLDPEFVAKGIPMGALRLFPDLVADATYDDNVYRLHTSAKNDFFFTEAPTLLLDYETSASQLDFYSGATLNQYSKYNGLNNNEYDFGARGAYEITRATVVAGNLSYAQQAEALSSNNTIGNQARQNLYNVLDASGQVSIKPNRLGLEFGGAYNNYVFQATPLIGGGTVSNTDRNNSVATGFFEGTYDFSPGYTGFVRGTYNNDSFAVAVDRSGEHRDSHGYQVDAGVHLLLGNLISGSVYLGYVDQLYDQHQPVGALPLHDISGLDFGAGLTWYPTELLTVQLNAARQIVNTTIAGAAGGDDRNVYLTGTYEVTRKILLTADVGYDDEEFRGATPYQDDKTPTFGLGGKYLLTHYVQLVANYQYMSRDPGDSALPTLKYNDNMVSVGVNLQI